MFSRKKSQTKSPKLETAAKIEAASNDSSANHRFEVANKVSGSATSTTLLFISTLIVVVVLGGVAGIGSLWKFVHPDVEIKIDSLQSLAKIAAEELPANFLPPTWTDKPFGQKPGEPLSKTPGALVPDIQQKIDGLRAEASDLFKKIPDADLAAYMHSVCEQVWVGKDPNAIAEAFQREILARVPGLEDGDKLAIEIVQKALTLCPAEAS